MPFDADTKALEGTVAWCETCHKYVVNGYCWSCGQINTKNRIDLSVYDNEPEGGIDVLRACIGVWKFLYEMCIGTNGRCKNQKELVPVATKKTGGIYVPH